MAKHEHYQDFLTKFEHHKTTDDCYTPAPVYQAVLDWVAKEYAVSPRQVVRPFFPGGDYEHHSYSPNAVVVDNPPFSILSPIVNFYLDHGIKFFLFAPALTLFTAGKQHFDQFCRIGTAVTITYENGAQVSTSFLTNLDESLARTAPELCRAITEANEGKHKPPLPKYSYPAEVVRATDLGRLSKNGIDYRIPKGKATLVRRLDMQIAAKKTIYGNGLLTPLIPEAVSDQVVHWKLSAREQALLRQLAENESK